MDDLIPPLMVTGEQIRGARAMLRLDQRQFAALTHVTVNVVRRMEKTRGPIVGTPALLEVMRSALEAAGIELVSAGPYEGVGGPGLRLRGEAVVAADVIDFDEAAEALEPDPKAVPEAS